MKNTTVIYESTFPEEITGDSINFESFEKYQRFTEQTIANLSTEITDLEQKLNVFTNLLEISQYINQYIKSQNLFPLINDMLIGVLVLSILPSILNQRMHTFQ